MSRCCKSLTVTALVVTLAAAVYVLAPSAMRTSVDEPPQNYLALSDTLASAGQPSAEQLRGLGEQGYELVVNLAPPQSYGSIADEGMLVATQGITYINIPVDWSAPTHAGFAQFHTLMQNRGARKTLVHCQRNMRASAFVFLHRVIAEGAPVDVALDQVHALWVPNATWSRFMLEVLQVHDIEVDPRLFPAAGT